MTILPSKSYLPRTKMNRPIETLDGIIDKIREIIGTKGKVTK